jgi:hypothetical protein
MMTLDDIKNNLELVNSIDWDMTPEEAVTLYLEWGNNWAHGKVVRSKDDVSYYFVVNNWKGEPIIYLIKRNSEEALELAAFNMPEDIKGSFSDSVSGLKGVYPVTGKVKKWLQDTLKK